MSIEKRRKKAEEEASNMDLTLVQSKDLDTQDNYLVFGYPEDGNGKTFMVTMKTTDPDTDASSIAQMLFNYKAIDAYLFALEDLKQKLELIRMRNEEAK